MVFYWGLYEASVCISMVETKDLNLKKMLINIYRYEPKFKISDLHEIVTI